MWHLVFLVSMTQQPFCMNAKPEIRSMERKFSVTVVGVCGLFISACFVKGQDVADHNGVGGEERAN